MRYEAFCSAMMEMQHQRSQLLGLELWTACRDGNVEQVTKLIHAGASALTMQHQNNTKGKTANNGSGGSGSASSNHSISAVEVAIRNHHLVCAEHVAIAALADPLCEPKQTADIRSVQ